MVTKTVEHCYGGIDVSMDRLDVMILPERRGFSVDNNAACWTELIERLTSLPWLSEMTDTFTPPS